MSVFATIENKKRIQLQIYQMKLSSEVFLHSERSSLTNCLINYDLKYFEMNPFSLIRQQIIVIRPSMLFSSTSLCEIYDNFVP